MQAVVAPLLIPVIVRRVVKQPHRTEGAGQWKVGVAAVLVSKAVIPIGLLESMRVPSPVNKRLPAGTRSVEAVARHGLVGDGRNGTSSHALTPCAAAPGC